MTAKIINFEEERLKRRPGWAEPWQNVYAHEAAQHLSKKVDADILSKFTEGPLFDLPKLEENEIVP